MISHQNAKPGVWQDKLADMDAAFLKLGDAYPQPAQSVKALNGVLYLSLSSHLFFLSSKISLQTQPGVWHDKLADIEAA